MSVHIFFFFAFQESYLFVQVSLKRCVFLCLIYITHVRTNNTQRIVMIRALIRPSQVRERERITM